MTSAVFRRPEVLAVPGVPARGRATAARFFIPFEGAGTIPALSSEPHASLSGINGPYTTFDYPRMTQIYGQHRSIARPGRCHVITSFMQADRAAGDLP